MTETLGIRSTHEDERLVLDVLEAAGGRGASHEDFIESGLARGYVAALRRLVDDGIGIRVDFTTGAARWALEPDPVAERRAA